MHNVTSFQSFFVGKINKLGIFYSHKIGCELADAIQEYFQETRLNTRPEPIRDHNVNKIDLSQPGQEQKLAENY